MPKTNRIQKRHPTARRLFDTMHASLPEVHGDTNGTSQSTLNVRYNNI